MKNKQYYSIKNLIINHEKLINMIDEKILPIKQILLEDLKQLKKLINEIN